jgi:hypothetical protein
LPTATTETSFERTTPEIPSPTDQLSPLPEDIIQNNGVPNEELFVQLPLDFKIMLLERFMSLIKNDYEQSSFMLNEFNPHGRLTPSNSSI